jgi:hypothetical protein
MRANIFINAATVKLFSNLKRAIVAFFARMAQSNVRQNKLVNVVIKLNRREHKMISKNMKRFLLITPLLLLPVLAAGFLYWYNPNLIDFSTARAAKQQLADLQEFALLKNTFESDSGYVRLITQLSPT